MSTNFQIVVFDLDGVITDAPSSWGYIHEHFGFSNDINIREYFEGKINDVEFMRRDIAAWKSYEPDLNIAKVSKILSEIPFIPGALDTLRTLRSKGLQTAIVSGGLDILAYRVKKLVEIDHIYANGLEHDNSGRLTGEGILNVPLKNKHKVMMELLDDLCIQPEQCVAVGDSPVDAGMLEASGLGIAFSPITDIITQSADVVIREIDLSKILKHIIKN